MCNQPIDVRRDNGLKVAIEAAGGVNNLARMIGTTSQAISQWERVPGGRVRKVSAETGVPDFVLRPDLYVRHDMIERQNEESVHGR